MRRILGGAFYVSAGVYLAVAKPPYIITVTAIVACAALAGLSTTRQSQWSIIGGAMLLAGSLFLQSILSYRCSDCIKANLLILAGIICLSVLERGKMRKVLRIMASVMTVMVAFTVFFHSGVAATAVAGAEKKTNSVISIERYITAAAGDGSKVIIDTSSRPALFFSPDCGACAGAVEALVKADPEGKLWAPVQVSGDLAKGREYLKAKGYSKEMFTAPWNGPVPALVVTRDGKTAVVHSPVEEMVSLLK